MGTWTLPNGMADEIIMIGCRPTTEVSEYDLYIKDLADDWEIFRRDDITGIYSEIPANPIPVWGNNAVYISGASVDGVYIMRAVYR